MTLECEVCGLAECDLPDEVDPEFIFERDNGITHCVTCELPAELIAEERLRARDYEAWADL